MINAPLSNYAAVVIFKYKNKKTSVSVFFIILDLK